MNTKRQLPTAIFRTFEAPKGFVRAHKAAEFAEATKLAARLQDDGRVVCLVYAAYSEYAVYVKVGS